MNKDIAASLGLGLVILVGAAALKWAEGQGWISAETVRVSVQIALGLMVAYYGNYIPKQVARKAFSPDVARRTQSALRFGGWALTLGGLGYAALWAFTPTSFADTASMIVLGAATLATLACVIWMIAVCRSPATSSGA